MQRRDNVVVIIFDTLRSDHLSPYGSDVATPNFDRLASLSTTFESAFAVGPGTPISHAGLYTGQYPTENGVTGSNIEFPTDVPVLAEWLGERGYETFGIAGPPKMGSSMGFDRGFDDFYETYLEMGPRPSMEYFGNVLTDWHLFKDFLNTVVRGERCHTRLKFDLLEERTGRLERPFFALANFVTVHLPYSPPYPYRRRESDDYAPPRSFVTEEFFDARGSLSNPDIRLDRVMNIQGADGIGRYLADPDYLNDAERRLLRDWYRAAVKYLDSQFGAFLDYYERELAEDTVLVVTSDHGEHLGEHGLWEHSHGLFDEAVKVPLFVAGPDVPAGTVRTDFASLVDVFDTLCDLLDLDAPAETSGRPLFGDAAPRDAVFMEYGERDEQTFKTETAQGRHLEGERLSFLAAGRKGIRTRDHLFVLDSHGNERLYENPDQELVTDPSPETVSRLRRRLLDVLGTEFGHWPERPVEERDVDPAVASNLEELGYID